MANSIDSLKAQRQISINRIEALFGDAERTQQDLEFLPDLRVRYERLEDIYKTFDQIHCNIIGELVSSDPDSIELEEETRVKMDNMYYSIRTIYNELTQINEIVLPNNRANSNVKLPKISLPHFKGDFSAWPAFIDLFNSLIHKNSSLSKVEKFQYLISSLSGTPANLLKTIAVTDDKYQLAYDTLVNRYQNRRKLATSYWNSIINLSSVKGDSYKGLQNLLDTFLENTSALKLLNFPTESWDFPLFNILIEKVDSSTRTLFERSHSAFEIPSLDQLISFLGQEIKALATMGAKSLIKQNLFEPSSSKQEHNRRPKQVSTFVVKSFDNACPICQSSHSLYNCKQFKDKTPYQRYDFVKKAQLCLNCLGSKHSIKNCSSTISCRTCDSKHHSLLHFPKKENSVVTASTSQPSKTRMEQEPITAITDSVSCTNVFRSPSRVLLSTVLVEISDKHGQHHTARALLDCGSQVNFITEDLISRLGLKKYQSTIGLNGVNKTSSFAKAFAACSIRPADNATNLKFEAYILPTICDENSPRQHICIKDWEHIKNLKLADRTFNKPGEIDLLLGADIFVRILRGNPLEGKPGQPTAVETIFGWILMGKCGSEKSNVINNFHIAINDTNDIDKNLKRFWEVEEVPTKIHLSDDETYTEKYFVENHSRDSSGRYVVNLPFQTETLPNFNGTRTIAIKRLQMLERRLNNNTDLGKSYNDFLLDYLEAGHMEPVLMPQSDSGNMYYIPHHCVFRPDSVTSKIRVVFDASAKDTTGLSLNDMLHIGPKLQTDITSVLLSFRLHRVALTGDIKQMYRQILIEPSQRNFQRIVWRFNKNEPIQDFVLNTVTYGTSSAPFLAIRTLQQLADDEHVSTIASTVLKNDIYIDDIVTGCDSLEEATTLKSDLFKLCEKGGFIIRKWASNHSSLMDAPLLETNTLSFDSDSMVLKILGLRWKPIEDVFTYKIVLSDKPCTKRTILSDLARTFDPLGFLSPVTFLMKFIIQELWTLGLSWDESPPQALIDRWLKFKRELPELENIQLDRHLLVDSFSKVEIHGFCDASEAGYAAVIYLRQTSPNIMTSFVCAKSKISPLKRLSIPRLELCAAHLLAKLIAFVADNLSKKLYVAKIFAWSDSSVALTWIRSSPHKWKSFVSNRVSLIHDLVPPTAWFYVKSKDNPADCASRGLNPSELLNNSKWWNGPEWFGRPNTEWPISKINNNNISSDVQEEEKKNVFLMSLSENRINNLLQNISSLSKIKRILAYCFRFIHNSRYKETKLTGPLVASELNKSTLCLVKFTQKEIFSEEISRLLRKQPLSKPLRKLNPFLDGSGVLRVGGRLTHSSLSFENKHPALLPRSHRLTELIISQFHVDNLHPGLQTLQYLISCQFWILSAKRAIKSSLSKCYRCFRAQPKSIQPMMGDLPSYRVKQIKPFSSIGIDYAGPFTLTMGRVRGAKTYKGYLCIFVCMATKAVHLELVSDLTSEAFLGALRRFVARRGRCSEIYSDCGTNFIGAYRQLKELMSQAAATEAIKWKFNPPSAPHFGGIWEAGVKSVKTHLSRVIGLQILTYEELATVFAQIEAVLNSRPLMPLSSDPNDLNVLTPGHFLTLEPLTALPDGNLELVPRNKLLRWKLIQKLHNDFWLRWHSEYLHTLQQRQKWNSNNPVNIKIGTVVLIKNELEPPLKWTLGRVTETHAGRDGIIRVATVRTANGHFKRPVVKLCPLPNIQE